MRIVVCGSRTFNDRRLVEHKLDLLTYGLKKVEVVSGGAIGVDRLAEWWAGETGWPCVVFRPDYERYGGKQAPLRRNDEMIEYAGPKGALIAFWQNNSPGTGYTIGAARRAGLKVKVVRV